MPTTAHIGFLLRGFANVGFLFSAPIFLKVYDETIAYSGLSDSHVSDILPKNNGEEIPPPLPELKIGDIVKWESGGIIQFEARRITGIAETKDFVFVEGSATGIPIQEVTIMESAQGVQTTPPLGAPPIRPPALGARQDVFSLNEGQVILQWPAQLSAESYEDFESWIQLQLRKIKRSIN